MKMRSTSHMQLGGFIISISLSNWTVALQDYCFVYTGEESFLCHLTCIFLNKTKEPFVSLLPATLCLTTIWMTREQDDFTELVKIHNLIYRTPFIWATTLLFSDVFLLFPVCNPEAMFCFCFQSPSLKLQALEADMGPLPTPEDPKAQENLPAQQQPLSAEVQGFYLTHKLLLHSPPSPPAQEQPAFDSSPGKTITVRWDNSLNCGCCKKVWVRDGIIQITVQLSSVFLA